MASAVEKKTSKTPAWMKAALGVSLALNLAIVGVVAGAVFRHDDSDNGVRVLRGRDFGFTPYIQAMDEMHRRDLGRQFLKQSGGLREARLNVRKQFDDILVSLRADPFDAEVFEDLISAQQIKLADRQQLGAALVAEKVAQMSEAERLAFAQNLEEGFKRGPRNGPDGKNAGKKPPKPAQ